MDIKLLEDFVCLARRENFTAASRERHITQSALSRRIRQLEQWLGTELIDRIGKQFALTAQGRVFLPEAEVLLRRLYNARETARLLDNRGEYQITVAAQNSIAQTLFLDWAKRVEKRLGKVYVRLLSEKLSECIGLLNRGHVSYLFCYANDSQVLPIDEKQFDYFTVGRDSLIPVTIPDQNRAPLFKLPGSRDNPLPFVAYARDTVFGRAVEQLIRRESHQCFLSRRYENPYSHTLRSLVQEKLGFAWLPQSSITAAIDHVEEIVAADLEAGRLCRAGDERWDIAFDIRLYHHHAASSVQERAILETTLEMAENLRVDQHVAEAR